MNTTDPQQLIAEAQHQLALANLQLAEYERQLKQVVDTERLRTEQLAATYQQLQAYAKDLKKAFDAERQKKEELEQTYYDTLIRLTQASRYKDEETGAHLERLSHYAKTLALYLGLGATEAELIFKAAPMHDVGKIGVPEAILLKRGPLDRDEWHVMQKHPLIGASLLQGSTSPLLERAREIALTHHEHWNGSGYPQGLKGEEIPLVGRIVLLADQYDALRSPRPYKPRLDHATVCDIILHGDGRTHPDHFDPRLLDAFRALHQEFAAIHACLADSGVLSPQKDTREECRSLCVHTSPEDCPCGAKE